MSTILPRPRLERVFFFAVVAALLASVLIGFWPSYFAPGLIFARLPSWIVHLHGALFVAWMALLVVQTGLVSSGNVAMHRKLGARGAVLVFTIPALPAWQHFTDVVVASPRIPI